MTTENECQHEWEEIVWDYPIMEICKKCNTMRGLPIRVPIIHETQEP